MLYFRTTSTTEDQRLAKNHNWLQEFRKSSVLSKIQFERGGDKTYPEYIALDSEKTNESGFFLEVKIKVNVDLDESKGGKEYSFYIEELTKKRLVISGWKGASREEKHIYQRVNPKRY